MSNESLTQITILDELSSSIQEQEYSNNNNNNILGNKAKYVKLFFGELLGTFVLITFTLGSNAQYKLFKQNDPSQSNLLSPYFASGLAVTAAIVISGKISGAHLNPAVSLAMLLTSQMSLLSFFIYVIAQFLGCFIGSSIVYVTYLDGLKNYQNYTYSLDTAAIFATYPNGDLSTTVKLLDQIVATSLLVIVVMALADKKNASDMPIGVDAIIVGFLNTCISMSYGYHAGNAINPARDLAPRIFTLVAGWGVKTFSAGNYFFWVPIIGPLFGSLFGTFLYWIFVSRHWL